MLSENKIIFLLKLQSIKLYNFSSEYVLVSSGHALNEESVSINLSPNLTWIEI